METPGVITQTMWFNMIIVNNIMQPRPRANFFSLFWKFDGRAQKDFVSPAQLVSLLRPFVFCKSPLSGPFRLRERAPSGVVVEYHYGLIDLFKRVYYFLFFLNKTNYFLFLFIMNDNYTKISFFEHNIFIHYIHR